MDLQSKQMHGLTKEVNYLGKNVKIISKCLNYLGGRSHGVSSYANKNASAAEDYSRFSVLQLTTNKSTIKTRI